MSDDNKHITDDLLVKYLLGETDATESSDAELWINTSDANKKYYADFKLIWQESERIAATNNPDEDGAWLRLQNRIAKMSAEQQPQIKRASKFGWLKVAASILLVSAIGYFAYNQFFNTSLISKGSGLATLTQDLPDGSLVTLNSNSQIIYPMHFRGEQRLVQLTGEGFFKITPDKTKPFIIKINAATVSVVGTSFNVKNVKGKTEVIVETGIVKVNEGGKQVLLHPGQMVITGGANLVVQETRGSLYNYYITKALICDRTPLRELVDKLNQVYGSDIKIANNQLSDLPITTTFKGQTLPQVLNIVSQTFKIKVENKGGQILLK
ncbi:FecR family protein [Mucilaginibacter flavidus]|uniref:FecR family protein n=1 Tax=Mucilaginibacter flavidus TaxID=2949309 RepID=UPI0020935FBD|nr:FecR domain-containing protein [Mucilaginibacter flavidus]MCO5946019.1 FecR domain-containing protein [Mucilaginibacter flavidus]